MEQNYPYNEIGQRKLLIVPVSFEANETGTFKLPTLPFRSKIVSAKSAVTKTVAGSNDGTIAIKKGSTTYATITVAASAAIGDEDAATSPTETAFATNEQYVITTAKSTSGGRALLYLTVEVLPQV